VISRLLAASWLQELLDFAQLAQAAGGYPAAAAGVWAGCLLDKIEYTNQI
jgi:hypothetical protein